MHMSDITFDMRNGKRTVHENFAEDWSVTCLDTGLETNTGGRLKKAIDFMNSDEPFCMTYGDGLCNLNISDSIAFHKKHGKKATVTAVSPSPRFGALTLDGNSVVGFNEKPVGDGSVINGGFFVLDPEVGELINSDQTIWEREPLESLARDGELMAYRHQGFWQPMDTLREKILLEELWDSGQAPGKLGENVNEFLEEQASTRYRSYWL